MKWLVLSVRAPAEFVEPLSQIFYRYGQGGVVTEQEGSFNPDEGESLPSDTWVTIKTYVPLNSTTEDRRNRIDVGVRLVSHVSNISVLCERVVEQEEWENAWKDYFTVLHIGHRTVICPSWQQYSPDKNDIFISLDPGMAFGTGHHPTTKMCLEIIETSIKPGMDIVDVGCGSGILSIASAKLGARSIIGLDIDPIAVKVAKQNIRDNNVASIVRIIEGSLPHNDVADNASHVTLVNISAKVASDLATELKRLTTSAGRIVASGIFEAHEEQVYQSMVNEGMSLDERFSEGDWITLVLTNS